MDLLQEISLWDVSSAVIIALLIIDRFTRFLDKILPQHRHVSDGGNGYLKAKRCSDMASLVWNTNEGQAVRAQLNQLYEWHNKEDEDGVKIWYIRRSLEEAVTTLAQNIDRQTRVLERLLRQDMP